MPQPSREPDAHLIFALSMLVATTAMDANTSSCASRPFNQ